MIDAPQLNPMVYDSNMLMHIIERAAGAPEFDLDRLQRLLELKERWDANEAEKAFNETMAAFKKSPPQVFADKKNKQYDSAYSSLGNFVNTVNAALGEHGLEASWEIAQGEKITVTCILAHRRGHKRRVAISGPPDTSGAKNPIQQIKSTLTYLELATFQAVTGIAVQGAALDDDGGGTVRPEINADVWTALKDASREGSGALGEAWRSISDTTRAVIVLHYGDEWQELKSYAGSTPKFDRDATQ